ncbi:membrane protein [Mycobacterium phage Hammy]|uniref:Membrane protein n=1 Tax=Mycobacterium phage DarthP TaxID=2015879 RepID=A0A286MRB5_9CAUD|nr:membrane protein [Mycobacterium phage DarthP]APD18209.1 membrane protein [Mycobacterium phage Hammy]ASW31790.1 membrane protein [Mycobacterium phage DarthP]
MTVLLFAGGLSATSLLIRRHTWRVPGELPATLAVPFFGIGLYLMANECRLGELLWHFTGWGYLDSFAGHLLWIGGVICLLYQALYRLAEYDERVEIFDALVRWPITLIVPFMVSAMYMSEAMHELPHVDIAVVPAGFWLHVYRVLWYGGLTYLSIVLIRLLRIVRATGAGRHYVARIYEAASWLMLAAIVVRVVSYFPAFTFLQDVPIAMRLMIFATVAAGASASWVGKMWEHRTLLLCTFTTWCERRADTAQAHRDRLQRVLDDQPPEPVS